MKITTATHALRIHALFSLATPLLLRSGEEGEFTDAVLQRTPDGKLHVNGYVWSNLLQRALNRIAEGETLAREIGNYPIANASGKGEEAKKVNSGGVSQLWFESTSVALEHYDSLSGNRIDREYGSVAAQALYNFELAPAGLQLPLWFTAFVQKGQDPSELRQKLSQALWIVAQHIETIGGGWGYGYGRLDLVKSDGAILDLRLPDDRKLLWSMDQTKLSPLPDAPKPDIAQPWTRLALKSRVLDGQLLCVSNSSLPLTADVSVYTGFMPDHFVHRQVIVQPDQKAKDAMVIPGKAFRQAALSVPLERRWRTEGEEVCDVNNIKHKPCTCPRCRLFGNMDRRGMLSVGDALVRDPQTTVLSRLQLCEHTRQVNGSTLFFGEYLSQGDFDFEIIIDSATDADFYQEALELIGNECRSMEPDNAPPGWMRLGKTATATGQFVVTDIHKEAFGHDPSN